VAAPLGYKLRARARGELAPSICKISALGLVCVCSLAWLLVLREARLRERHLLVGMAAREAL